MNQPLLQEKEAKSYGRPLGYSLLPYGTEKKAKTAKMRSKKRKVPMFTSNRKKLFSCYHCVQAPLRGDKACRVGEEKMDSPRR